jgi:hypothetical protein
MKLQVDMKVGGLRVAADADPMFRESMLGICPK